MTYLLLDTLEFKMDSEIVPTGKDYREQTNKKHKQKEKLENEDVLVQNKVR